MNKINSAHAEWDDPHGFRVFLVRDNDDHTPMCAAHDRLGESIEGRLYRAAVVACPLDFAHMSTGGKPLTWRDREACERVAQAVNEELDRMRKGLPGPSARRVTAAAIAMSQKMSHMVNREPFGGKVYGIWNVEGDSEPLMLMSDRAALERELERRRALPEDDRDRLTEYHHVFPADIAGAWWNSHDPDPREESPLTLDEIVSVQGGDL